MTFTLKGAPVLKQWNCCCKCGLRTAAVALGWIQLVFVSVFTLAEVIMLTKDGELLRSPETERSTPDSLLFFMEQHWELSVLWDIGHIIMGSILLYGIHMKKPLFLVPFLVAELIELLMFVVVSVIISIAAIVSLGTVGLIMPAIYTIVLVIWIFLWIVFYSYYQQLENEKNPAHEELTGI